jgi:conjugative transposon TraJ protein
MMRNKLLFAGIVAGAMMLLPFNSRAAGIADDIHGLQATLDSVYNDMLPLCGELIGVGRAIAGFGALLYISYRVWRQIANAEPIDFYPLMRPFALGIALIIFPGVIAVINGVMQPTVTATSGMVQNSDAAIEKLLQAKEAAVKQTETWQMYVGDQGDGDREKWYKYTHPDDKSGSNEGLFESVGNDVKFAMAKASYNFRNTVKQWMSEVLQVLYEAAALCINTIRTFYLIVLAILGPIVFGLAVFDGFQHTLSVWLAKYINVFLWLPVANIFGAIIGKVQENMLKLDISQVENTGDTFFSSTDTAYLIFLIIGILGYFTVPGIAGYIVNAGGGNGLLQKVNTLISQSSRTITQAGTAGGQRALNGAFNLASAPGDLAAGYRSGGRENQVDNYQAGRLSGDKDNKVS